METRRISELKPWSRNPRGIKKDEFERLKRSITKLGTITPLSIGEDGTVLSGNMRLRAYQDLGITEVPVFVVHPKNEEERVAIALAANDRAGYYEEEKLAELVLSVPELELADFKIDLGTPTNISALLDEYGPTEGEDDFTMSEDRKEPKAKLGDLYHLGGHRVLCGDSTNSEHVQRLLCGNQMDMVFSDPPYNVAYSGTKNYGGEKGGEILNDNMSAEQFVSFTEAFMLRMTEALKQGGVYYICSGYSSYPVFLYAIKKLQLEFSGPIVWVKDNTSLGWNDYRHKHELMLKAKKTKKKAEMLLYGWKEGPHYFPDSRFEADVWQIRRRGGGTMVHPTQKPIEMIVRAIKNSSKQGERVLDLFGGSGSTLIGAERSGRIAHIMELDPHYVSVILDRWASLTGRDPIREDGTKWSAIAGT